MDIYRLARAATVVDQLANTYHQFVATHPGEDCPIYYALSPTDIMDVNYVIHEVQTVLVRLDHAIETLQQLRSSI